MNVAILGSGNGSNAQSLIDAVAAGTLNVRIVCVLSDVEDAGILDRARRHGIPAESISATPFKTKLDGQAEQAYLDALRRYDAELICLAGFMRILKTGMLNAFKGRILNIHPSLLPAFPGIESWKQALAYGAKVAGCTVHLVDAGTDTGPILVQRAVPVMEDDTPETLHARIQGEEHQAYPAAVRMMADGAVALDGRRAKIRGHFG